MPEKVIAKIPAYQDKKFLAQTVLTSKERDLTIESLSMLLSLIGSWGISINGDPHFTKQVTNEIGKLVVRLQYDSASKMEIN